MTSSSGGARSPRGAARVRRGPRAPRARTAGDASARGAGFHDAAARSGAAVRVRDDTGDVPARGGAAARNDDAGAHSGAAGSPRDGAAGDEAPRGGTPGDDVEVPRGARGVALVDGARDVAWLSGLRCRWAARPSSWARGGGGGGGFAWGRRRTG